MVEGEGCALSQEAAKREGALRIEKSTLEEHVRNLSAANLAATEALKAGAGLGSTG